MSIWGKISLPGMEVQSLRLSGVPSQARPPCGDPEELGQGKGAHSRLPLMLSPPPLSTSEAFSGSSEAGSSVPSTRRAT